MKHKLLAILTICAAISLCACGKNANIQQDDLSEVLTSIDESDIDPGIVETADTATEDTDNTDTTPIEDTSADSELYSIAEAAPEIIEEETPEAIELLFNNGQSITMEAIQNVYPTYQIGHESDHKCVQYDFTPHLVSYYDSGVSINDEDALMEFYRVQCAEAQSLGMESQEFKAYEYDGKQLLMSVNSNEHLGLYTVLQDIGTDTYLAIQVYDIEYSHSQSELSTQNVAFAYLLQNE